MTDLLKTGLHAEHMALNAKMAPFAGFDMPLQYSSVKEEIIAVRENVGVFDVSHMGEFFVEGDEAVKFVDYMLTNDFAGADVGKAVYSPLCRENGTIIDDLIAYKLESNKVLICVNAANIDKDYSWLESHVGKFNCSLSNHSNNYQLLALQGPKSESILKECGVFPEGEFVYYSAKEFKSSLGTVILARTGYTGEDGFEIFGNLELIQTLWKRFMELGVTPCGLAARDVLRLEVAYPLYGHELSDEWTPLDAALAWTVKKEKEAFIGKDFLADYKPKFRLIKLSLEKGIPREGFEVLDGNNEVIGKITSGTMSVTLGKGVGLALVEKAKFPKDKVFKIQVRKNIIDAEFHSKAFISGGHK